jgi:hypothetical protein
MCSKEASSKIYISVRGVRMTLCWSPETDAVATFDYVYGGSEIYETCEGSLSQVLERAGSIISRVYPVHFLRTATPLRVLQWLCCSQQVREPQFAWLVRGLQPIG